jgi:hypothetical protein
MAPGRSVRPVYRSAFGTKSALAADVNLPFTILVNRSALSRRRPLVHSAAPFQLGKWIVPISNAPRPINPVAAVALSIGAAFVVGLLIAFGIIWAFS